MLLEKQSEQMNLTFLFAIIDDLVRSLNSNLKQNYLPYKRIGRPARLCASEMITLAVFRYFVGIKDVKAYHRFLLSHYNEWFPKRIPEYASFNRMINRLTPSVIFLLQWTMYCQRQNRESLHFIDSTAIKVCGNKRIFDHQVCHGLAKRGKSSMGWFFGFKLHAVCDSLGRLVNLTLSPGNLDDRKVVLKLLKDLKGIVVADAGYIKKEHVEILKEKGVYYIYDVKKNMKRLMTKTEHALLKLRQRIEVVFSVIKYRYQAEASVARSPLGFFSRLFFACFAYQIKQLTTTGQF